MNLRNTERPQASQDLLQLLPTESSPLKLGSDAVVADSRIPGCASGVERSKPDN